MPPRKRAKASAASTPLTETQPKTPQDTGTTSQLRDQSSPQNENILSDPWTDDQVTWLFKSMMKWKPTGIHKHFRMISIQSNIRSHGFATDDAPHTRIPGVWRKLDQLFDLRALDEREVAYTFQDHPDPLVSEEAYSIPEFELPEEDFGQLMWDRRFHGPESAVSSSPPFIPVEEDKAIYQPGIGLLRDLPGGSRSQNTERVLAAASTPKNAKSTRASRAASRSEKTTKTKQSTRSSRAQLAASESAEEEEEEEEEDEEDKDGEEEESAESEADTAPSTRRTNRSGGGRAKQAPKRTRKR